MKFLRRLLLLTIVLLLLGGALLALLPAKLAVQWAGARLGAIRLDEVSGTLWNGRAGSFSVHDQVLGALQWQLHPTSLLARRLDADLVLDGSAYRGRSAARLFGDQTIELRATEFEFPAELLRTALDVPGLTPQGRVEVKLEDARLVSGYPQRLKGEALWRSAAVAGEAAAEFGDLKAEFSTVAGGKISGVVKDQGGPLQLDGSFELAITGFDAEAILAARDGNAQVQKALGWIGEPQPDGSSLLKITGTLLPIR